MNIKLKELLELKYGKRQSDVEDPNGAIPIYGTGGIFGKANKALCSQPSILIGRKGTINKPFWVNEPFWCVDTMFYSIIDSSKVLPKYLFYNLSSIDFINYNEGTTIPSLRVDTLNEIDIHLHTKEEQQHIVDILGSIDDKIENNEEIIRKINDFMAKLFLKFSLDCNNYRRLDEICSTITKGTTPTTLKKSFVDNGIPFIKVESLTDSHQVDINKTAYIDGETHELLCRSQLQYKDLLLSIAGTIGRFALLPKTMQQANTNQAVALIRGKDITQEYLYALFSSGLCTEQIAAKTVQAVQANLSLSVIGSLIVPVIADEKFNKEISQLYSKIESIMLENNSLHNLKSIYLQKFFG